MTEKEKQSIELIRRGENLALSMNPEGYFVGFSGGKDSQVLLELVKRAGVKYKAYYSVTTNDPPKNVRFIREHYPEVIFLHPRENFYKLIEKKGLPTRMFRYCCNILKEQHGAGQVVLTGVRKEESIKRGRYNDVSVVSTRKEHADRTKKYSIDTIEANEHKCIKGKDKIMVYPILRWTTEEVWQFIKENNIPTNPCYEDNGRVGCMMCPFSNKREIEKYERQYPKMKKTILKASQKFLDKKKKDTKFFATAEEYYEWWKSKKNVKEYMASKKQLKMNFEQTKTK
jgi:phosphoadenosine phosphosulfate reductase